MLDPVGTAKMVFAISETIYKQAQLASHHERECKDLATRIRNTVQPMEEMVKHGNLKPEQLRVFSESLVSLEKTLVKAQKLVGEMQDQNIAQKFFFAQGNKSAFGKIHRRLTDDIQGVSLGLGVNGLLYQLYQQKSEKDTEQPSRTKVTATATIKQGDALLARASHGEKKNSDSSLTQASHNKPYKPSNSNTPAPRPRGSTST